MWIILPFFARIAGGHFWISLEHPSVLGDGDAVDPALALDPPVGPSQSDQSLDKSFFVHPQNVRHEAFPYSVRWGKVV